MEALIAELRTKLEDAVKRNVSDAMLLSGGLDTSILALLTSKYASPTAFTVALRGYPALDVDYAKLVATSLGMKHKVYFFSKKEALEAIPEVVRIMKSFDPMEVRNDVAIYIALRVVRQEGMKSVTTGDGADELFAGYNYMIEMEKGKLRRYIERLSRSMQFASTELGKSLKLTVKTPYLDPEFVKFAVKIDPSLKVKRRERWGKWILRKAFEGAIPAEVAWRAKSPIEVGSGTQSLRQITELLNSDDEFRRKIREYRRTDGVEIRDKEHLYYYEIYRSLIGVPKLIVREGPKRCPHCGSGVPIDYNYCRTCGAVLGPIQT